MCKFFCTFAPKISYIIVFLCMKKLFFALLSVLILVACSSPDKAEERRIQKHAKDSVSLVEQTRSLAYYQAQLDELLPQADSLIALFKYEKNEKYQDHGYYVTTGKDGLRILVRDDGQPPILLYRYGKRIEQSDDPMMQRAEHLSVVMQDVQELEKRIQRTSREIQKYEKRLQKEAKSKK